MSRPVLTVLETGPGALVQDLGRFGYAALGVGRSGPADSRAHRLANALVGNDEDAATVEVTLGGLVVHTQHPVLLAVTGAIVALRLVAGGTVAGGTGRGGAGRVGAGHGGAGRGGAGRGGAGRDVGMAAPVALPAGAVLHLGPPLRGLRSYLAVRGGVDVPPVLGSRSTDVLSGIGPPPLRAGDTLPIGVSHGEAPLVDHAPQPELVAEPVLRILPGPRVDWFDPDALSALTGSAYEVQPDSNRVGLRLRGPGPSRRRTGELPSEPLVAGAIQVPTGGQPVLFGVDHPVTGGYPVLAVLRRADLDVAGQLRPGQRLRFTLR